MKTASQFLTAAAISAAIVLACVTPASAREHKSTVTNATGTTTDKGGPIAGRVESDAGRGVRGARIVLKGSGGAGERSHRTNSKGHFIFRHLKPGRYALTVMKPGFYPKTEYTDAGHKGMIIHLGGGGSGRIGGIRGLGAAEGTTANGTLGRHGKKNTNNKNTPQSPTTPSGTTPTDQHLPHRNGHQSNNPSGGSTPGAAHAATPAATPKTPGKKK